MPRLHYLCPNCQDDLIINEYSDIGTCCYCKKMFRINFDATFENGLWRDKSILVEINNRGKK